jgi:hypothetical protein
MSKQPGLNLTDLAPMFEDVPLGDSFLRVHGISAKLGFEIFQRFPKMLGFVGQGFDLKAFLSVAPDATAAIIAASTGNLGNEVAEEAASRLGVETQFDILEAVGRLTFPKGFAPFVQRIMALGDVASSANYTRVPDMKSPQQSRNSSPPDTLPQ